MSAIHNIRKHIETIPLGKPFTTVSLLHLGTRANIDKVLSRLVTEGFIERVARGIYVRPKKNKYINRTVVAARQIAEAVAQSTGEVIAPHGAEAARQLQLSTQTPTKPIYYTTGTTRHIKHGKIIITLKHVSPRKLTHTNTTTGLVISALRYLGKNNVTASTIKKIENHISKTAFTAISKNMSAMPGWMSSAFYTYNREKRNGE